ncbi:MAG TPA: alpha/beta hydrolase [Kineosporiaceae bacterium]|nr:alpha/beta hydrolase [Kineosporiaceae bacterium]
MSEGPRSETVAQEGDPQASPAPPRRRTSRWRRVLRRAVVVVVGSWLAGTLLAVVYVLTTGGSLGRPALGPSHHDVRTGDLVTHYEQWGTSGPPVVLVHGFLESSSVWDLAGPMLAARGYRVYALDVRGFGYTERRGPYTLDSDTDQLRAFLGALHLTPADRAVPLLVGHSSGAAIVTDLALRDPGAARRIVLMDGDGTPYGAGPAFVHALVVDPYATALVRLFTRHPALAASAVYGRACGPGCPPFDADAWTRPFRVDGAEPALVDILGQPLIGLTYAQEEQVHVPATIVYGTEDPQMSADDATATARRLRTADVVPLPGAAHLGMLSHPALLVDAVDAAARSTTP